MKDIFCSTVGYNKLSHYILLCKFIHVLRTVEHCNNVEFLKYTIIEAVKVRTIKVRASGPWVTLAEGVRGVT